MTEDKLKLPRSSYEELCKIIIAYGRLEQPASLDKVNSVAGVGKTTVSANNSFLTSIGVIEGGKTKIATPVGKKLAHALLHEIPEDIQSGWRSIVEDNEFLRKMALALKIRKTMDESSFVSHICYSAGETKSSLTRTGARAVIDILRSSGFISEEDGKLFTSEEPDRGYEKENTLTTQSKQRSLNNEILTPHILPKSIGGVSVNIEIRVEVKPEDIATLGKNLKAMLTELESRDDNGDDNV